MQKNMFQKRWYELGQAYAEYMPTLVGIGTFAIVIVIVIGGQVSNSYKEVNCGVAGAAGETELAADCPTGDDDDVPPPPPGDDDDGDDDDVPPPPPGDDDDGDDDDVPPPPPGDDDDGDDDDNKVLLCHVAGLASDPANWIILEVPVQALNGHFDNNGTPKAGHEEDFLIVTAEDEARCAPSEPEGDDDDVPPPPGSECPADLSFEGVPQGTLVSNQFAGVTISSHNQGALPAMIFNSGAPTGGDTDLGTPNRDFNNGPGRGNGGKRGKAGENSVALGNVLIISTDGNRSNPNDHAAGGTLIFAFDNPADVSYLYVLDQDSGKEATIKLFGENGSVLMTERVETPSDGGDNGVFRVDLNQAGVARMEVKMPGSGAVASVFFCEAPTNPPAPENPGGDETCDCLDAEPGPTFITVRVGTTSYLSATLGDGSVYDSWCVDYDHGISTGREYDADLRSSDGTGLVDKPQNMDLVQYIINQDYIGQGYSKKDIQAAIWTLIDDTKISNSNNTAKASEIVADAQAHGEGYEPECGGVIGLIVEPSEANAQHQLIEYPLGDDCE